jgi:hypothetical protein
MAVYYWMKTLEYDTERMEGLINAVEHYYQTDQHILVNALYHKFKNYNKKLEGKLFLFQNKYEDMLEYYNSISAFYANDKISGYECCKKIIINNTIRPELLKKTYENMLFYKNLIISDKDILLLFNAYKKYSTTIENENENENKKCIYEICNLLVNLIMGVN